MTPWTAARQAPLSMGILQARILEWVAMPSSRGSSQPRDQSQVSPALQVYSLPTEPPKYEYLQCSSFHLDYWFFLKFIFNWRIIVLISVLVFSIQFQSALKYTCIPCLLNLPPTSHPTPLLQDVMEYQIELPLLCRKFLLAICFTYGNV